MRPLHWKKCAILPDVVGFKQEPFVKLWCLCKAVCSSGWLKWPLLVWKAVSLWAFDHLQRTTWSHGKIQSQIQQVGVTNHTTVCIELLKYQTFQMLQIVKTNNNKTCKKKKTQKQTNKKNAKTTIFLWFPMAFFPIPFKHFCYFCPCWGKSLRWLCWLSYWILKLMIAIATSLLLFISKIQSLGLQTHLCAI